MRKQDLLSAEELFNVTELMLLSSLLLVTIKNCILVSFKLKKNLLFHLICWSSFNRVFSKIVSRSSQQTSKTIVSLDNALILKIGLFLTHFPILFKFFGWCYPSSKRLRKTEIGSTLKFKVIINTKLSI